MLLFDLSRCCNCGCNFCHRISCRHRLASPRGVQAGVQACTPTHARAVLQGEDTARAGRGRLCKGARSPCVGLESVSAAVLTVACRRLGVRAAFSVQNGAGFPAPYRLWPRHVFGNGLLKSLGAAYSFGERCWGGGGGLVRFAVRPYFWLEASVANWTAALFVAQNSVCPNAVRGGR